MMSLEYVSAEDDEMGDVELLSSHRLRRSEEIVDDIAYALKCLGGAAHISILTSTVEAKLRSDRGDGFRHMGPDVEAALKAYDLDNSDRTKPALFTRPFGPNSHRWALLKPVAKAAPKPYLAAIAAE